MRLSKNILRLIGIIVLIVILTRIDFGKLFIILSRVNIGLFIMISSIVLPVIFIKSYRWRYLLKLQGINYSIRDSFVSYAAGISVGMITPGRVGETIKAIYLKDDKGVPFSDGLVGILLDRLFDLFMLVFAGYIGFCYFLNLKDIRQDVLIISVLFIFVVVFLLTNKQLIQRIARVFYNSVISRMDRKLSGGKLENFLRAVKRIVMQRMRYPFILTALAYLLYFIQCYLLARLASVNISFITVVFLISAVNLISILPVTIMGIGTREAGLIYLFSLLGLGAENAVVFSFLIFISSYLVSGILGGLAVSFRKR